jgi:AraC-like DNA-binding protein
MTLTRNSDSGDQTGVTQRTERTHDPDLAHDVLARTYAEHRYQVSGSRAEFRFSLRTADAGSICLDTMRHSMNFQAQARPLHRLTAGSVASGAVTVRSGREEERFGPGEALLYPYGDDWQISWTRFDQTLLRMRFETVADLAALSTGLDATRFRFLGMRPISPAMGAHWRSITAYLERQLAGEGAATLHPLMLAETENMVAGAALSVFPNTTLTLAHPTPEGHAGPAALRRAVDYVVAHADQPLTLAEIAENVGVGPRELRRAFATHCNTTPMRYLRRVRLDNAHRDLRQADPDRGDSVARIARRWGFADPTRFADHYQRAFGTPPDHTLHAR